jgi:hypothetical protein
LLVVIFLRATTSAVWSAAAARFTAEEANDFEQAGQSDQCVYESSAHRASSAEEISHYIVLEKANQAPVQRTDDQQQFN